ncbi:hypothetical protein TVAG_150620 [Trichomonas vaginalis G3]|uniref:DUF3447 domain-containing protein n=1 Tax=Trichomonas vaginalis (strain ATCC PRA-98 / G3) TaxID=412133 RepID=A2DRW4_TRIV3|nr:proteasome regulatory particle assembly [Trichomonas vaginalis G3]EAY16911.1 hypothetical protein TVAG_150620 [Trichomonas vaginalis G3]KAI5489102.1 proteasome regulatory particle assembly [Trichomonas vaginalis G3]|eukprot:XP_001329134.1 hypothetical protein [Trichomonas vaginalis G3]
MFYEKFPLVPSSNISPIFQYFLRKEFNINIGDQNYPKLKIYEVENYFIEVHLENTIYRAIMDNNKESFIVFIENERFDKNQKLKSDFYPESDEGYTLLELCCYHGAVDCFKLLRSKFKSEITPKCLEFSFLGGNPEIMTECLKEQEPNKECMKYAIASHNIDFVTFLVNEYDLEIDCDKCSDFYNLQAFFAYFDQTNRINKCFILSPLFNITSLCEYFLGLGADINAKSRYGATALHAAAVKNSKEMVQYLISLGADVTLKDKDGSTPLHFAVAFNTIDVVRQLISCGADINAKDNDGQSVLFFRRR